MFLVYLVYNFHNKYIYFDIFSDVASDCISLQLKMREQVAETQRNLPLRLRIFEKFPYVYF